MSLLVRLEERLLKYLLQRGDLRKKKIELDILNKIGTMVLEIPNKDYKPQEKQDINKIVKENLGKAVKFKCKDTEDWEIGKVDKTSKINGYFHYFIRCKDASELYPSFITDIEVLQQ